MYGTVYRIRPKTGKEEDVVRLMQEWDRERRPKVRGAISASLYKLDNGGMMGAVVFESKEAYTANASDPDQDRWYQRWRALLEADPEWNDGAIVNSWQA